MRILKKNILKISSSLLLFIPFINIAQEGEINIIKDKKIDKLVTVYQNAYNDEGHYTVQIFFGRHQTAERIKNNASIDFPNWPSKLEFDSPHYKVRIGKFKTKLEAERNLISIRKKYSNAILLRPKKATR